MKKRFKQADGTEVEVEGSPEELAEYERKIREGSAPVSVGKKSRKPVLHGAAVDDEPLTEEEKNLVRMHRLGFFPQKEPSPPVYIPQFVPYRLGEDFQTPCWVCGQYNCKQLHIWCGDQTWTGTKLTMNTADTQVNNNLLTEAVNQALTVFDRINKTPSS